MALIMLCGLPSSGKTYRASQLHAYLSARLAEEPHARLKAATLISDHTLSLPRTSYASAAAEKTARATLYSAVKRALSPGTLVILDSGNYIKGWRYQLHCEAKALRLRSCVLHAGVPPATARALNAARAPASAGGPGLHDAYDAATWDALAARFEEPNGMARWDAPLYTLAWDDEIPGPQVWASMVDGAGAGGRALGDVKPHAATVAAAPSAGGALAALERGTQSVVAAALAWQTAQAEGGGSVAGEFGGVVDIRGDEGESQGEGEVYQLRVPAQRLRAPHLQRLRRQFVTLQRQQMGGGGMGAVGKGGGGLEQARVVAVFVDWLNDAFERGA